jgi:hypothetical protein
MLPDYAGSRNKNTVILMQMCWGWAKLKECIEGQTESSTEKVMKKATEDGSSDW